MKTKRFLATLLCLLMMASLFPTSALADDGPDPAGLMDAAGETGKGTDEEPADEAEEDPATEPDAEPMAEPARSLRSTNMTVFAAAASCTVKLYLDPGPEAGTVSVSPASGWTVGQKITLTATAYSGYTFMWWVNRATGEYSTSSTYTTTLTGDCKWDAVFRKNGEYFIYISKPWVENDPSQTLQVSPDASSYASGTPITLNAPAKSGRSVVYEYGRYVDGQSSSLTSWTRIGGNSFSMPAYDVLVRGLYSVNLTLSTGAHGTATLSPSSGPYYEDDVVTLTVNPDSGYRALIYGIPADYTVSGNTYTFTVGERDLTISVEFEALPAISLDVGAYPNDAAGSVSISKNETYISQNETYGEVTLTATPKGGYHFLGWYDMGSSSFISEANPYTFEPTQSMTIYAYFYVSVYKANVEHGTLEIVDEKQVYAADDVVTLKGTPDEGYVLDYYLAGKLEGSGANLKPLEGDSFTMPAYDMAVGVKFAKLHTISALASPNEGGTVTGAGQYKDGAVVTLTATANSGYHFVNWTENGAEVSADATCSFTASANRTLVANFELIPVKHTISVSASPAAGGTVSGAGEYEEGKTVTLTATANSGYRFVNWTENGSQVTASESYSFTAAANRTLTANFQQGNKIAIQVDTSELSTLTSGQSFRVPIRVTTNTGFAGAQIKLSFDNSKLTLDSLELGEFADPVAPGQQGVSKRYIRVGSITTETGLLFYANFTVKSDAAPGATEIGFEETLLSDASASAITGSFTSGMVTISQSDTVISYPLWVGGVQVDSANKGDILGNGTASYDPDSSTLTLTNANITGVYGNANIRVDSMDLTISLTGSNSLSGSPYTIRVDGDLTIAGGGSLTASGAAQNIHITGGNLIIDGCVISATSTGPYAISVFDGDLTIKDSSVTATADGYYGLSCGGALTIRGDSRLSAQAASCAVSPGNGFAIGEGLSITTPTGGYVVGNSIKDSDGNTAKSVVIDLQRYPLFVGGVQVTSLNEDDVLGDGTVRFEGDASGGTLTLNNASILSQGGLTAGIRFGDAEGAMDLILRGSGVIGSTETSVGLFGIGAAELNGDFTIHGKVHGAFVTDLKLTGGTISFTGDGTYGAVYTRDFLMTGGNVTVSGPRGGVETSIIEEVQATISGGTLIVDGGAGNGLTGNSILISGGTVKVTSGQSAIDSLTGVTISGGSVEAVCTGTGVGARGIFGKKVTVENGIDRVLASGAYGALVPIYDTEIGDQLVYRQGSVPGDPLVELIHPYYVEQESGSEFGRVEPLGMVAAGDEVRAIPDDGYEIESMSYTPEGGDTVRVPGDSFEMPAANVSVTFRIKSIDISKAAVSAIPDQEYTGGEITPKPTTVTWNGKTLAEGRDYTLAYKDNHDAGTATVTMTGCGNFTGTKTVPFTITPKALTITAEAKSKTYGEADPALIYTADGLVGSDTITGELTRAAGENVGSYAITQGTLTAGDNYAITFTGAELTIGAKALTITAEAKSKTYGEADPALTYTADGLVGSDTITGELTRAAGENVGSYAITQGALTAGDSYAITFTGAELTIEKAAITITADDKSSKYGEDIAELTVQIGGEYKTGDDLGVTVTTTATRTSDVGEYPITVSWNENPNYSATLVNGKYTITKTDLAVSAAGYSGVYDKSAHGITVDVGSSDAAVYYAETELTSDNYSTAGSTTNPTYTDAGEYTVYFYVVSGNYVPDTVSGSKTVVITAASGTADETQGETPTARTGLAYTGEPQELVTAPENLPEGYDKVQYSLDGGTTWTDSLPTGTDAGDYTVSVRYVGDKNHEDFSIASIPVTIKATWTVKYEMGGAEAIDDQKVVDGEKPVKPADPVRDGYTFDGWYADGDFKTVFGFSAAITADTTVYAMWTAIGYAVTAITGTTADSSHTWRKGSTTPVVITVKPVAGEDHSFAHFVGVDLDGRPLVLKADYTAHEGSTVVTLKPAMLEKISLGDHTVTILFDNGKVDARLTIKAAPTSPATGDDRVTGLWAVLTILSAMGMGGVTVFVKKRRYSGNH